MPSRLSAANEYDNHCHKEEGPLFSGSESSETEHINNGSNLQGDAGESSSDLDETQATTDSSGDEKSSKHTVGKSLSSTATPVAVGLPYGGEALTATLSAADRTARLDPRMTSNNCAVAGGVSVGEEDDTTVQVRNTANVHDDNNTVQVSNTSAMNNHRCGIEEGNSMNQDQEEEEDNKENFNANADNYEQIGSPNLNAQDEENPVTRTSGTPAVDTEAGPSTNANEEPEAAPTTDAEDVRGSQRGSLTLPIADPVTAANPVEQADPTETVVAEVVPEQEPEEGKRCFGRLLSSTQWAVGALLILVLIAVGIIVSLIPKGCDNWTRKNCNKTDDTPTIAPTTFVEATAPPTPAPASCVFHPPFSYNLHFLTSQALKEPCSPQSKANSWMMQDPSLDSYSEDRKLQRFALATLYFSTGGQNWKDKDLWLSYDHDECQWFNRGKNEVDRVCNDDFGMIHLDLSNNNLEGVLPVELFLFHALADLNLSRNFLKGTAPTMFAGARYLKRLDLSSNQLTGQFTAELGFVASNLAILQNDDNFFTGAVPGLLRLLPSLSRLNITGNLYTGALPESLIQLSSTLEALEVANNAITGAIPSELGAAKSLELFDVGGNYQMRGTIPTELASLSNLTMFDISGTGISGSLPGDLCSLEQAGQLTLVAECGGPFECCSP